MTIIAAKWTIDEYHRMIEAGILEDRKVELLKGEIRQKEKPMLILAMKPASI